MLAPFVRQSVARPNPSRDIAFESFRRAASVADVMRQTGRSQSTIYEYLCAFIRAECPASIDCWVAPEVQQRVLMAVRQAGTARLRPIFVALGEKVSYDDIRLVLAHLERPGTNGTA
jgi:ATP-dependent DNA helicase RecQ